MKDLLDFGRTEVPRVDFDDDFPGVGVDADFIHAGTFPPTKRSVNIFQGESKKLCETDLMSISSSANAFSTNSRTGCVSPVARTKSSGSGC